VRKALQPQKAAPAALPRRRPRPRHGAALAVIAGAGLLVYAKSLGGQFLWDDLNLVRDNTFVQSWAHLGTIFARPIGSGSGVHYTFYRPVQMLTYLVDHTLWGINPFGYHLAGILWHVLAAFALYGLVVTLFGSAMTALVAALLFVLHPVHTEAVCYVAGRADPLSACFLLSSILLYARGGDERGAGALRNGALVAACFVLAFLSKESALIAPVLMLLVSVGSRRPVRWRLLLAIVAIAIVYAALRVTLLRAWIVYQPGQGSLPDRIPGALAALASYVSLLVVPYPLRMEYGFRQFPALHPLVLAGGAALAVMVAAIIAARGRRGPVFTGLLWFLVALLPVSNLYLINAFMAEHWLYVPSVGIFIAVAWGLSRLAGRPGARPWVAGVIVLAVWVYGSLTVRQCRLWRDPVVFYEHTLKYAPESLAVNLNLAAEYARRGRHIEAHEMVERTLAVHSGEYLAQLIAGVVRLLSDEDEAARLSFLRALELNPRLGPAHNNLAVLYLKRGDMKQARHHAEQSIRLGCPVHAGMAAQLELTHAPAARHGGR
jgi:tetratricopeptide (TPR) repeat protein